MISNLLHQFHFMSKFMIFLFMAIHGWIFLNHNFEYIYIEYFCIRFYFRCFFIFVWFSLSKCVTSICSNFCSELLFFVLNNHWMLSFFIQVYWHTKNIMCLENKHVHIINSKKCLKSVTYIKHFVVFTNWMLLCVYK